TALRLAGNEATVLELSWYGAGEVAVPLGEAFHSRRLRLISSQVGQVAPSHRPRWSHRRRLEAALVLLADPALDALLAPAWAFYDLPAALPKILGGRSGLLCQLIRYPAAERRARIPKRTKFDLEPRLQPNCSSILTPARTASWCAV